MKNSKKFKIHWLDGKTQTIEGRDFKDAFMRAGYGAGAVRAIDFYNVIKDTK